MAEKGVTIRVRVTPRGGRDAVIGYRAAEDILLVRVAAAPVEGAANKACIGLLAAVFGVKRHQLTLISGETAREKRFLITGMTGPERDRRLTELPPVSQS